MCTLRRNGTQGWKLSLWLIYQEVAQKCSRPRSTLQHATILTLQHQTEETRPQKQKQDRKVLWGHFYVPKHESSTPGAGCRLLYNEIYADIGKIFCHKGPTGNDAERQWFAVSWCGT